MNLAGSLEQLRSMPDFLMGAIERSTPGGVRSKPAPDGFSLLEHACHLRDLEREGYLVRVRRMLAEKRPVLQPFDGTAVAHARNYLAEDPRVAAQEFAAARNEVVGILAATTRDDLRREARFAGEAITLEDLVEMMIDHDREHRVEIASLLDAAAPPARPGG